MVAFNATSQYFRDSGVTYTWEIQIGKQVESIIYGQTLSVEFPSEFTGQLKHLTGYACTVTSKCKKTTHTSSTPHALSAAHIPLYRLDPPRTRSTHTGMGRTCRYNAHTDATRSQIPL